jgi:hypothetical protein
LQALLHTVQRDADVWNFQGKTLAFVSERNVDTLARTAAGPYSVLLPDTIVFLPPEAMDAFVQSRTTETFLEQAELKGLDIALVNATTSGVRPWNVLTLLVNYMLAKGVGIQTVLLLLMLPVIATILALLRQVVGMTTFGLFSPSIIALSFLALGWWVGLIFLIVIVGTGYLTRALLRNWHILYIPKLAIILTVGSIILLLLLGIGASFDVLLSRDAIFILLIMSTLSENFLTAKSEGGWREAIFSSGQTVLAALICVLVVSWSFFQSMILAYPELILLTIVINAVIGRWTGLRLSEYFRFRDVFKHLQEE